MGDRLGIPRVVGFPFTFFCEQSTILPFANDRYGLLVTVQGQHKRPTSNLDRTKPIQKLQHWRNVRSEFVSARECLNFAYDIKLTLCDIKLFEATMTETTQTRFEWNSSAF